MAQELTIQAVEGMTKAVDNMSTAFKGLKTSIGSIKGTNALKELQAIVGGVNRLETALKSIDNGLGNSMATIVNQLEKLPGNIANALGRGAGSVRKSSEKLGEATGEGMVAGITKSKSAVKTEIAKLQAEYEAAVAKGIKIKPQELAGLSRSGVSLFPSDREIADTVKTTQTAYNRMFSYRNREAAKAASEELRFMRSVESDTKATWNRIYSYKARQAKLATDNEEKNRSVDRIFDKAVADMVEVEKAALAKRQGNIQKALANIEQLTYAHNKAKEADAAASNERQLAIDRIFYGAQAKMASQEAKAAEARKASVQKALANIEQAVFQHTKKREALEAESHERQLKADRIFYAVQASMAANAANPVLQVRQATRKAEAPYSPYNAVKALNDSMVAPKDEPIKKVSQAMGEIPAKAKAAGASLTQLGLDANTTHSAMRGLASGFGLLWLTWGNLAPLLAGAAISNGFMQTMKMGLEVNKLLEQTRVLGEESSQGMAMLESSMLSLSTKGPYGLREVAEAIKTLTLAGLDATQTSQALASVLDFAVAGDTNIKLSAETMTSVATAFKLSTLEYSIVADTIAKTAAISKASIEDMAEAFKASTVLNKQYGASLNDVSLGLALLSNLGIKGSAAGVALRNMYVDLAGRTKAVRTAMKELGISVVDSNGKFLSFYNITKNVAEGLDRAATATDKLQYRQAIFSERGMKPIIESLDQYKTKSTTYVDALNKLQQDIADKAGFASIAAAQLAVSNVNAIKSVFTTLQTSAFKAFEAVEPEIFGIAKAFREAFASDTTKNAITTLVSAVAGLTKFLTEHGKVILYVAGAYAVLKTAQFATGAFAAMSTAVQLATTAMLQARFAATMVGPQLAATGVAAATMGSTFRTVVASSAAATTALTAFGAIGSRVLAFLAGPWGLAMAAAAAAYGLYATMANKAADAKDRFSAEKSQSLLEELQSRAKMLNAEADALSNNVSTTEVADAAKARVELEQLQAQVKKAAGEVSKLSKAYKDASDAEFAAAKTGKEGATIRKSTAAKLAKEELEIAKKKYAEIVAMEAATAKAFEDVREASRRKEKLYADKVAAETPDPGNPNGQTFIDPEGAKVRKGPSSNALAQIEKLYRDQADTLSKALANQQKLLEAGRKSGYLTEAEYAAKTLKLIAETEAKKIELIQATRKQYGSTFDKVTKGLTGTELENAQNSSNTFNASLSGDRSETKDNAFTRQAEAAIVAKGEVLSLKKAYDEFWASDAARIQEASSIGQLSEDVSGARELVIAFGTAAKAAAEPYASAIAAVSVRLDEAKAKQQALFAELSQTDDVRAIGALATQAVAAGEAIKLTEDQLAKLKATAKGMAEEAGLDNMVAKYLSLSDNDPAKGFDKAGKAMAGFVNAIQAANRAFEMQESVIGKVEEALVRVRDIQKTGNAEEVAKAKKDEAKLETQLVKVKEAGARAEIRQYANIAGAAKNFFKEKSKGYKLMEGLEKGFRAFEMLMSLKSMGQTAIEMATKLGILATSNAQAIAMEKVKEAALAAGKVPGIFASFMTYLGPYGIPAAAAAIAAIGLSAAGRARGSFAPTNDGTGTVFGDSSAKGESVANAIEQLADNSSLELQYSQGMLSALKNIEANIGGVTNQILRSAVGGSNVNVNERTTVATANRADLNLALIGGMFAGPIGALIGGVIGRIPIVQKITSALFGTKTSVKGTGLFMGDQSLSSINSSGANLSEYADVNTKKKFFGITYSNKNSTITGAADETLSRQFALIFQDFYKSLQLAAVPLGKNLDDVTNRLNNFVVSIGKIDLQGLTGEQIQEKLTAVLGAAADNIAAAALPGFEDFQKVGEGYFETVIRVANGSEVARVALDRLGIGMVSLTEISRKQGDVAVELIRESLLKTERIEQLRRNPTDPDRKQALGTTELEAAYTGVGKILQAFEGTADELIDLYTALMTVRQGIRDIGKDATSLSLEMIKAAGGLDALQQGLTDYYENYLTDAERLAAMTSNVSNQFAKAGIVMPDSIEGFKKLVQGQETLSVSGQETFGKLIALSGAFYELQEAMGKTESAAQKATQEREDLLERLKTAEDEYAKATLTSVEYAALQRNAIDSSNRALYDQVLALEAQTAAAQKAATERKSLQDELNTLTLTEAQQNALKRDALEESNRGMFDQIQAIKEANAAATAAAAEAKRVGDERYGLEGKLLELQGKTSDLRARELEKLAPENRELQKSIWALEDAAEANRAAQEAADAANQAAEEAANKARELKEAWTDAANGIFEEIKRIRGAAGSPQQNLASAQADFSIAVAKAKAGDVEAAKELPKLSQNLLKIAEDSAKSSAELALIQGRTLASLERTLRYIEGTKGVDIPGFANGGNHMGGVRMVGEVGPEVEATGPARIYTAAQTRQMLAGGQSNAELAEGIRQLNQQVSQLVADQRAYAGAIVTHTASTAKILRDVAPERDAINIRTATP